MRFSTISVVGCIGLASSHVIPQIKRQTFSPDFKWGLIGYELPGCRGNIVANWRGSDPISLCIPINATRSIAGGSGSGTTVNLWQDGKCTSPAGDITAAGVDSNSWPCYNAVVKSFTVEK